MNSLLDNLEKANSAQIESKWTGSFRQFLLLFESGEYKNLHITSHERIENMILSYGTSKVDYFGTKRTRYNFFEDHLFGIEETIDNIMLYLHSAAQKSETARRMLLLYGPVSTGKSDICTLIKRGLEKYSKTKEGAIFALQGSKMHENPFLLIPDELRQDFEKKYNIRIDGRLSPHSQWRLENEFKNSFLDFPIERIFISESARIGIGTFAPGDTKSTDFSELVGSIDFSKIQDIGDEADPRAFNFNGELNVANRGIIELVEGLKNDEKFLRVLLTATQEKQIKAPRFGFIFLDAMIILHTNESEFMTFISEKKYEAYHDRMFMIKTPYNLKVSAEKSIYEKLLNQSNINGTHIAPHTIDAIAMFATMTRIESQKDSDLSVIKKMKLYDGQSVKGYKKEQVLDLKKKSSREGMSGISPRFVIDQISIAISKSVEEGRKYITALDILRQLQKGITQRDTFKPEEKNKYKEILDIARQEWNALIKNDIQKAFFIEFEEEAKSLCANYLEHIESALSGNKPRDPITNEEVELNEKLMDAVESHLDISHSGKDEFRNEILRYFGSAALKGKLVDYSQHVQLKDAIQKQLFQERQSVIRLTVSTRNPDPEALRRLNDVINRMVEKQNYTVESANEILKYATAHLFDK